ncbi:cytoplasmic protein [Bacillus sp. Xin]|uniref:S4 domain-containing protein n=1 Tax=unclassified Bacillus (in: firmicutes) TaxID=185979 RepID=UPI00157294CC|nr:MULTISPECIES: S4 domain-containing protein [unclassified Bacillus (in: firmicutes)]MBC6974021.1 cytoplasmic protein [Bacillus sp. Xin]MCI0766749.1 cytoplasmic protein [Bacillus sp. TL12]NSW38054.1 cytoplasmic protein [Bacillus sp. Xin1]
MQKVQLSWNLYENEFETTIEKHCKNCGHTTLFIDTNIRRHNANGKNIYRFAIYKCPKGHTWNKKLHIYKSFSDHVETIDVFQKDENEMTSTISIMQYKENGTTEITIVLETVLGSHRIDKALSTYISDWSRTLIVDRIKNGHIQLNGQRMKPNTMLSEGDLISICL